MLILFVVPWLAAAATGPQDLIAVPNGQAIYFRLKTGVVQTDQFLVDLVGRPATIASKTGDLVDIDDTATVRAYSYYAGYKTCGFGYSSCFTAPACAAATGISTPDRVTNLNEEIHRRNTFLRLDRSGSLIWIEERYGCVRTYNARPNRWGLYDRETLLPVFEVTDQTITLANRRVGRRLITSNSKALTVDPDGHLRWLSASGWEAIPNTFSSAEAVTDRTGCNIAYATAESDLHWLGCETNYLDEDLQLKGASPAMSEDGRYLAYIDANGALAVYDRALRKAIDGLLPGQVQALTISGRNLFAFTSTNALVRMDLESGEVTELLPLLPEIESLDTEAASAQSSCLGPYCYGPVEPAWIVQSGQKIAIKTRGSGLSGWTAKIGDSSMPATALQIPNLTPGLSYPHATLTNPAFGAIELYLQLRVNPWFFPTRFITLRTAANTLSSTSSANGPGWP